MNQNYIDLVIEDINIKGKTDDDKIFLDSYLQEVTIASKTKKTLTLSDEMRFSGDLNSEFTVQVSGTIAVQFIGIITKPLAINTTLHTSLSSILTSMNTPTLQLNAYIDDVTSQGVIITTSLYVDNQNPFTIEINDVQTTLSTDTKEHVIVLESLHGIIPSNSAKTFTVTTTVDYSIFNSTRLELNSKGQVDGQLAGIRQSIPLEIQAQLHIPELSSLLFKNQTMDFSVSAEFKLRLKGILTTITFSIYNPTAIPLKTQGLHCSIMGLTGEEHYRIIAEKPMDDCLIPPGKEVCVTTEVIMPYRNVLRSGTARLLPTWFVLRIQGNLTIENSGQMIPIALNGYIDPHLFR